MHVIGCNVLVMLYHAMDWVNDKMLLILGRNQLKGVLDDLVSQVKEEKQESIDSVTVYASISVLNRDVDVEEIDEEVEEAARDL